ncbi:MAG TPA: rhomboid family intramembrane serine protease [Arenimonas sp.]|nr:rhomboid family intramembrane serine protease [Arenimonas sp.]
MDNDSTMASSRQRLQRALTLSLAFVAVLGGLHLAQPWFADVQPALALRPRELAGLLGVLTAPLLHGSLGHWLSNAVPLLVLGTLAGLVYPKATPRALPLIWLGAGLGTWLIGRDSGHIGASGLTHGLGFYLFLLGLLRRDRPALATAMIAFFLYGGMLLTVLPREAHISWEYHLSGAIAGAIAALLWRRLDPAPPRPAYSWEIEPENPAQADADALEPPRPAEVPVLWQRAPEARGVLLPFRRREP